MAYHIIKRQKIKSHKKPGIHYLLADSFKKKLQDGSNCPPSLFRIKNIFMSLWLFLLETCKLHIFAKYKVVTFICINIVQGNNFPKQYHALNTIFRLFASYAKISNIFWKISCDGQNFQAFKQILIDCQNFQVFN